MISENEPAVPAIAYIAQEGRVREESVALDWPLDYGGRRVDTLVIRRLSVAQVEAFIDEAKSAPRAVPPMLFLPTGEPVPKEILDALDADDDTRVFEVVSRFLPRRLQPAVAPIPASGEDMSPPSQAA